MLSYHTRISWKIVHQGAEVDSIDNVADLLTKLLSQQKTEEKMGLRFVANWL